MLRKIVELLKGIAGVTGVRLKYGPESGPANSTIVTMGASFVYSPASSLFVTLDASGNAGLTGAASTTIFGHLIAENPGTAVTGSSTAGADLRPVITALDTVYRVPVGSGTYSRANRGKMCDLVVAANVQGAAVQVSTRSHIQLLDGDETNNKWVIARINPAIISSGTAA